MKAGAKFTYDVNKFDAIIASVIEARGSFGQVADLNEIPRQTFYDWLTRGEEDRNNGLCTDLGQLSCNLRKSQANVVIDLCTNALNDDKRARFIMWWLSKICREDFGVEGMEIKELKDLFRLIAPLLGKGFNENGFTETKKD